LEKAHIYTSNIKSEQKESKTRGRSAINEDAEASLDELVDEVGPYITPLHRPVDQDHWFAFLRSLTNKSSFFVEILDEIECLS